MKTSCVFIVILLVAFACKRREEFPAESLPDARNLQLVEINESNLTAGTSTSRKYGYDGKGRVSSAESQNIDYVKNKFVYGRGKLLTIISEKVDRSYPIQRTETTTIQYDSVGRIHAITHFIYPNAGQTQTLTYNEKGEMIRCGLENGNVVSYSNFTNNRWTTAVSSRQKKYGPGNLSYLFVFQQNRDFDSAGRLVFIKTVNKQFRIDSLQGQQVVKLDQADSSLYQYTYLESPSIHYFREQMISHIQTYICPNLDAYELLPSPLPIDCDFLPASTKAYKNGVMILDSYAIIEQWNEQGLPQKLIRNEDHHTINGERSFTSTIRYEELK